jgi:hypothetical protein
MYRPQFPYAIPPEFRDKDLTHYFDQNTTTQLNNALSLAAGATLLQIPLQLETSAPFWWRGIKVNGPSNFAVRFKDPFGNYLSDDWVPLPIDYAPNEPAVFGSNPVDWEPAIECLPGSIVFVDVKRIS